MHLLATSFARFLLLAAITLCISHTADAQETFIVTVQVKTAAHPYFGQGDPEGYVIDGVEGAELTLERGQSYIFQMQNVSAMHPFYISTSSVGSGSGVWSDGVTGNFATGNSVLTFDVPTDAPDLLWYQCLSHPFMGWQINIVDGESAAFTANMSGGQEVPANQSRANGTLTAALTGSTLVVEGSFQGLIGTYTGAHIHLGYAGQNGPIEIPLVPDLDAGDQAGSFNASENTFELSADQIAALQARRLYVNVHSNIYPPGEIRGQLLPAQATSFYAALTGRAEVPANASQGSGAVVAELDGTTLTVTGSFSALSNNYTASHIHLGELHESGPVVFPLDSNLDGTMRAGTYAAADNTFDLTPGAIASLTAGEFYINVHSQDFPPGEVRGQLFPVGTQTFEAFLLGVHETPPVETAAQGGVIAHLDGTTLRIGGAFAGLESDFTAAHIHEGVVCCAGGVVFPLTVELASGNRSGTFPVDQNTFTLSSEQVGQLFTEALYINVHSVDHPPGEIRGQMLVATNLAPTQPIITNPADGATVNIPMDSDGSQVITWDGSDPNSNRTAFYWRVALDPGGQDVVVDEFAGFSSPVEVPHAEINELLDALEVPPDGEITLYHRFLATDGGFAVLGPIAAVTIVRAPVSDEPGTSPVTFTVSGPAPNPVSQTGMLTVDLPETADVTLSLYDVAGRRVMENPVGMLSSGSGHVLTFETGDLAAGFYIYRVRAVAADQTFVATGRLVLIP